jgi:SAM-dependent methyltransferase
MSKGSSRAGEWDEYGAQWVSERPHQLWRKHSDAVNSALIRQWLPVTGMRRVLKTDLFDEAVSDGVCEAIAERTPEIVGLDVSAAVLAEAGKKSAALSPAGADVRSLPFRSHSFDAVVSLSTLDHFDSSADVMDALRELHRVLVPGGTLILTLDNLANPVIALRNALPYRVTHAAGLVPYPVGRTFRPQHTRDLVIEASFEVVEQTAVMHAPRVLAVPLMYAVNRNGNGAAAAVLSKAAMWFERLRPLPSRFITGHFVAIKAVKPG